MSRGRSAGFEPKAERSGLDDPVERAAERHVERQQTVAEPDRHVPREHERRDVAEADGLDPAIRVEAGRAGEPAARHVDGDVDRAGPRRDRDTTRLDGPRHQRDRPVTARGRVALVVEEHDAEIGPVVVRRRDEPAVHVGMTAWFVDDESANIIEVVSGPASPLEDRPTLQLRDAPGHDPERLAGRVVVDGPDRSLEGLSVVAHRVRSPSSRALTAGHSGAMTL